MKVGRAYKKSPYFNEVEAAYGRKKIKPKPNVALSTTQRKQVKGIIAAEDEDKYTISAPFSVGSLATAYTIYTPFLVPAVGAGANQLVGDSINVLRARVTMRLQNLIPGTSIRTVRMIFFQWKVNSVPLMSQILQSPIPDIFTTYNIDEKQSYTILSDKLIPLGLYTGRGYDQYFRLQFTKMKKKWNFQGSVINGIYMAIIADNTGVRMDASFRLDYTDA